ncbi:uncharacterized protein LOC119070143 [Bradysia coprophila]|uniref:uncharacterized protein LOC119070143 n=1 Tax=Bradysia coprophila TaxID=38358 RepID=UPI00187D971C|nr:uncharacterized protein LOC119070143 [Bradysia coprophila]
MCAFSCAMMSEENVSQLISVEEFRKKIAKDASLPQNIDDILLQRFLKVYDNKDLKKSLDLLKYNLITRKNGSQIFFNRDPLSDETQTALRSTLFCPMPKLLDDQYRVNIVSLIDYDVSLFDYIQVVKMAMMNFDARFIEYDNPDRKVCWPTDMEHHFRGSC